jgi:hypothetical protein
VRVLCILIYSVLVWERSGFYIMHKWYPRSSSSCVVLRRSSVQVSTLRADREHDDQQRTHRGHVSGLVLSDLLLRVITSPALCPSRSRVFDINQTPGSALGTHTMGRLQVP